MARLGLQSCKGVFCCLELKAFVAKVYQTPGMNYFLLVHCTLIVNLFLADLTICL